MKRLVTRHPRLLEAGALTVGLMVLAGVVYGPHTLHGGFLSDAWGILAAHQFAPDEPFGATKFFLEAPALRPRPLFALYLSGLNTVLGAHMGFWLAWLVASGVLGSVAIYALLRELRVGRLDAGIVAALLLLFPATSSLRLWTTMVSATTTIALTALGFLAALRGFGAEQPRRALAWHGVSLLLFVCALLLYEITLPLMLASVLLYRLRVPWGRAARRWLVDCALLLPLALIVKRSGPAPWEVQGAGDTLDHARAILDQAQTLLATVVLPFGTDRWYVLALLASVPLTAVLVASRLPSADPARSELRRWLLTGLGGAIVVVLSYAIFVPAMDYYAPMEPGVGNRVNAVPGIGWVLIAYAAIRLVATMAWVTWSRVRPGAPSGARRLATGIAVTASALLAIAWLQPIGRDADAFERAYLEGQRVMGVVGAAVADPPSGSTIWTFGQPVQIAPGVPVFASTWDLTSRVRIAYDDPTLASFVAYRGTEFKCGRARLSPSGHYQYQPGTPGYETLSAAYGRVYFVDTTTGRVERIDTPAQCRRAAATFPRSPEYPPV